MGDAAFSLSHDVNDGDEVDEEYFGSQESGENNDYDDESDPLASDSDAEPDDHEELFGPSVDTLLAERRTVPKRRRRAPGSVGAKRRVSEVPSHLTSMMGSATIAYMSKRFDDAEECLARVIEKAPRAVAPYRTLSLIMEERGNHEKALEYLIVAAELDKKDVDLWKRCAAMCHELGDVDRAQYCLSTALHTSRGHDPDVLRARAQLFFQAGNYRRARDNFVRLAKLCPGELDVAARIGIVCQRMKRPESAEQYLRAALEYVDGQTSRQKEDTIAAESYGQIVQLLVEIQFTKGFYDEAVELLGRLREMRALGDIQEPLGHRVMSAICQYRNGARALATVTFIEFMSSPETVNENPNLMWFVAETFFDAEDFAKAAKAYSAICEHDSFKENIKLFLNRSKSYERTGQVEDAAADLQRVLRLRPGNSVARINLLRIQQSSQPFGVVAVAEEGENLDSSRVLVTEFREGGVEYREAKDSNGVRVLSSKANSRRRRHIPSPPKENYSAAIALLDRAISAFENSGPTEFLRIIYHPVRSALVDVSELRAEHGTSATGMQSEAQISEIDNKYIGEILLLSMNNSRFMDFTERVFEALMKPCDGAFTKEILEPLFEVASSRIKGNADLRRRLRFLHFMKLIHDGDDEGAFEELRANAREHSSDSRLWWMCSVMDTYMSLTSTRAYSLKIFRFLKRQASMPDAGVAVLMAASTCSARSFTYTFKSALRLLSRVHRQLPTSSLCCLCMGTNMLYLARSRNATNRELRLLHAFTFMDRYRRLRRLEFKESSQAVRSVVEMEIDYNIGRAMHDVGLLHLAASLYRDVLNCGSRDSILPASRGASTAPIWVDLKREAAYNLFWIYRACGAVPLAQAIMHAYLKF